ncbi:ParB/RepB/Spo0J family partition protein [Streptomyces sp. HUAS TT7]|uniref:ParB/RepB/Spo0J family partition protein n=1 Tax=Streptomyces sp. HUAS TT7 TaxID=3447507 RepID=UPI003F658A95
MHTITGNPENPRQPEDYTDEDPEFAELKDTLRQVGQLQPVAVVSHGVFVRLKPEFAKSVDGADWIVVGGNRRLAAARQLGWTRIDIRVQDRLGDDDGKLDEAVIIENIHRKKIDPIKEAEFLHRMVKKHGSQDAVAQRIGKTQMYVSHRLALLKLDAEVKNELEAGTVKPAQVRGLASKPPEEQRAHVDEIKRKAATPKPRKRRVQNGVLNPELRTPSDPQPAGADPDPQNAVLNDTADTEDIGGADRPLADGVPEPRQASAEPLRGLRRFPYDDGEQAAYFLDQKMSDAEFFRMADAVAAMATQRRERAGADS